VRHWNNYGLNFGSLYADHESELENAELAREIFDSLRNFICNKFCNNPDTGYYIIRVAEFVGNGSSQ